MGYQFTTPLSELLREAGYRNVVGTIEKNGFERHQVEKGAPYTWDANNGVRVVHDEVGDPWIKQSAKGWPTLGKSAYPCVQERMLKRGAYVPHSNDSGEYVKQIFS